MVKRPASFSQELQPNLRGGEGIIEILNFFDAEDFAGMGRLYGISIIHPGCSIGQHTHTGEQEAYYILEGVATYNDNGREDTLYPGDLSICRDGEFHAIRNDGDVDLKYIALISYTKQ